MINIPGFGFLNKNVPKYYSHQYHKQQVAEVIPCFGK
jgi:hypothetical protein